MLDIFKELSANFSETQLVEFIEGENCSIVSYLKEHSNNFTDGDIVLIRSIFIRDSEIFGW